MARRRPPLWLVLSAAAYLAYFGLLIYCHLHRPAGVFSPPQASRVVIDAQNLTLPLGEASIDPSRDGVLLAIRTVQLITLGLAITVALRRPRDPVALSGAWLLATAGVFSIALPAGWATAWRMLPPVAGAFLWFPFLSTLAGGLILLLFAAQFTRHERALPLPVIAALGTAAAIPIGARAIARMALVYGWDAPPGRYDDGLALVVLNAVSGLVALLWLFRHYGATPSLVEKRRARFVLAGGSIGLAAGVAVMLAAGASGPRSGRSFFASTSLTIGTSLFLLFPLSFAYAILRYRLFGLKGAIRLGLRYAVARRALLSIVPLAAGALVFDIWSQGDRPLRDILSARAGVHMLLAGGAIAAHLTRDRWLEHLDRTFFRERYDARRILIELVTDLRSGRPFGELSSLAIAAIDRALHPTEVTIAVRGSKEFASWDGSELVVPVATPGGDLKALIRLGPKRSEEPYSGEDRELLAAIADGLAIAPAAVPAASDAGPIAGIDLPHVLAGRYRLERELGRGGMGVVYAATDLTLDRQVAVKVMRDEIIGSEQARQRFRHEARAAARFSHPNVITIHDFETGRGNSSLIVMELLAGHTLRSELSAGAIRAERAVWIVGGMSEAVDAAHAHGLLHRDLKPENVFLAAGASGESVKVLDFGVARPIESTGLTGDATAEGALIGTLRYMAPEQIAGGEPSPSWDLWSLAVMACEMVTGSHPFAGSRPGPPVAPPLEAFFRRALAARPADRFASARELHVRLGEALGVSPV